jgi:hypothetical protein
MSELVKLRRTQPEHISSALPPTAAVERTSRIGSFVPLPDSCTATTRWTGCNDLFDHLVGAGEERRGYFDAECFCRSQVHDEIEFGRLLGSTGRSAGFTPPRILST